MPKLVKSAVIVFLVLGAGLASLFYWAHLIDNRFSRIQSGDTRVSVVDKLGPPRADEAAVAVPKESVAGPCSAPCDRRLWWTFPVIPLPEAWVVDFDTNGRVIRKVHLASP